MPTTSSQLKKYDCHNVPRHNNITVIVYMHEVVNMYWFKSCFFFFLLRSAELSRVVGGIDWQSSDLMVAI